MKYEHVRPIERQEAESLLQTNDRDVICETLVRMAFHEPDVPWAQKIFMQHAQSDSAEVRSVAATCLGHLARIHRAQSVLSAVPILKDLLRDPAASGAARAALDDIGIFLK